MAKSLKQTAKEFKRKVSKTTENPNFHSSENPHWVVYESVSASMTDDVGSVVLITFRMHKLNLDPIIEISSVSDQKGIEECLKILSSIKHNFEITYS